MASISPMHPVFASVSLKHLDRAENPSIFVPLFTSARPLSKTVLWQRKERIEKKRRSLTVVAAAGDVSADGTTYLIAGAAAVALLGTAFPILFSRKDTCPECDGAGFVRKAGATLRANAARKDEAQIVCARCNGLGKLNQIDK